MMIFALLRQQKKQLRVFIKDILLMKIRNIRIPLMIKEYQNL